MKILLNIFGITFFLFLNTALNAQKTVSDTLAYAKKFETNKQKYIGKPFSLLLKDMTQLQFKKAKSDIKEDQENTLPSTIFRFSDKEVNSPNEVSFIIKWKTDNLPVTPIEFFEQEHSYRFTINERNFFEKKIIKDIVVYK
ncbi:hypothetical protein [Chryseobacterium sp. VD8]|uniref:hypothetical protein n=1 Tax=Chryseobacterium sp. VD8 TaxID=3081254 RepID=UPI003019F2A0